MAQLVDYSDLDFTPISNDQYIANLYNQLDDMNLQDNLTSNQLEYIIDPIGKAYDTIRPWLLQWMYRPGGPVYRLAEVRFYNTASNF